MLHLISHKASSSVSDNHHTSAMAMEKRAPPTCYISKTPREAPLNTVQILVHKTLKDMPSKNKFWKNQIHVLCIYASAASTCSLIGEKSAHCKWCGLGTQRAWPLTPPSFSGLEQMNPFLPTPDPSSVRWDYNTTRQSRCNMVRMHAKLPSCVWLFETLMDSSPSGSSVHGILQARILEWVAMPSSRGSSQHRGQTHISYVSWTGRQVLYHWCHLGTAYNMLNCIKCMTKRLMKWRVQAQCRQLVRNSSDRSKHTGLTWDWSHPW